MLNNRLSGSIDAYATVTTDLLFKQTIPGVSGKTEMLSNVGKIKNRGFEIGLHSVNIQNKDFSWTSDFAFSLNRNKVASIYGEDNKEMAKRMTWLVPGTLLEKHWVQFMHIR